MSCVTYTPLSSPNSCTTMKVVIVLRQTFARLGFYLSLKRIYIQESVSNALLAVTGLNPCSSVSKSMTSRDGWEGGMAEKKGQEEESSILTASKVLGMQVTSQFIHLKWCICQDD